MVKQVKMMRRKEPLSPKKRFNASRGQSQVLTTDCPARRSSRNKDNTLKGGKRTRGKDSMAKDEENKGTERTV